MKPSLTFWGAILVEIDTFEVHHFWSFKEYDECNSSSTDLLFIKIDDEFRLILTRRTQWWCWFAPLPRRFLRFWSIVAFFDGSTYRLADLV